MKMIQTNSCTINKFEELDLKLMGVGVFKNEKTAS